MFSLLLCLLGCAPVTTTQIATNDGLSTLYIPERGEIWRDNSGNATNDSGGEWLITRTLLSPATTLTAIDLPRRPIGEIMRRDPTTGWVYVPTYAGSLSTGPKYLQVINAASLGYIGEVEVGVDFDWAFWQFNPFNGDLWSLEETTSQFRAYDKGTGSIAGFFDADAGSGSFSSGGQFIFTAADKLWVLKLYPVAGVPHVALQRYDVSTLPDGALSPEFELDLEGVGYCLTYDAAQNAIWFLFNTPNYASPFGAGLTELKKFDLSSETVVSTTTMPSGIVLDSPEFEIMYVAGGTLWIVDEDVAEGTLYGVATATGAITNTILLSPYEAESCFGGTIAFADSTYIWHGDAGCGFIYRTDMGCVPSGGGGGGGGGGGATQAFQWVEDGGIWNPVKVPSPTSTTQNQPWSGGAPRPTIRKKAMDEGTWKELGSGSIFVLDPDNPDDPDGPPCPDPGGTIDPLPDPVPFNGVRAFALYNMTKNLLDTYRPFNASITGTNAAQISALLAAIAARSYQYWIVPVFRREQVQGGSAKGPYDHTSNQAKLNSYSPFSDANAGVMPFGICYDDINCGACWGGREPTVAQVDEGTGLFSSIFGIPAAIRLSPILIQRYGFGAASNVRIGIAQYTGPGGYGNAEGFGADYAAFADAQFTAAASVGLDGVVLGMNPFRELANGWRSPPWTDAFLEEVGVYFAGFGGGMNYGLEMWLGYPPSMRVMTTGTNAAIQAIVAAL